MGYDGRIQVFDWKKSVKTKLMTLVVGAFGAHVLNIVIGKK
jgi:hypothetical protein